jgi:hypothetical protein
MRRGRVREKSLLRQIVDQERIELGEMLFALRRAVKPQIVTVRETPVDVQIGVDPGVAQFGVDDDGVAQQEGRAFP